MVEVRIEAIPLEPPLMIDERTISTEFLDEDAITQSLRPQ